MSPRFSARTPGRAEQSLKEMAGEKCGFAGDLEVVQTGGLEPEMSADHATGDVCKLEFSVNPCLCLCLDFRREILAEDTALRNVCA